MSFSFVLLSGGGNTVSRRVMAVSFVKELERISKPLAEFDDEGFCPLVNRIEIGGNGGMVVGDI